MTFLKENELEIRVFQGLHRISLLGTPQKGSSELTCTLKVPMWNVALEHRGMLMLFIYLVQFTAAGMS